ncbi:DNA topoisomerase I [Candidatus Saccharibacteria bacterium]|nr:MAG: DNA topoisomerase I [Candidatus Saccharibacteria bacterium]PID99543.1 MAG: DNA topoisomerase I [Candidatus Saccharibacteria bacterium]
MAKTAKNLVIVESPAKAKTIEQYLGSDFTVLSSVGHIRAIPKKTKDGTPPVDIPNGFATTYEVDPEKKKIIAELKRAVKAAETVWLATDEDREGEAIAWHLCEVLGLDADKTKRIVFHEITKNAISEAIEHPRTVDMQLVQAQQARQILDRIVGFELSPVVWQKVPGGKSAGRVQSPAVKLLVEREREIQAFAGSAQFKLTAEFTHASDTFSAELPRRFDAEQTAHDFLETLADATFSAANVSKSPGTRNPSAPFTTSTLQQEANAKLGFGSRATMAAAQKLYQSGKITYMRTDSMNISKQAVASAASYIEKTYGKDYVQVRTFRTKAKGAQEAHEAIRPTNMALEVASSNSSDQKLYDLIRRRTLASQMAAARLEKTTITISAEDSKLEHRMETKAPAPAFEAKGEVITFDGFLKVYGRNKEDATLPPLTSGDKLQLTTASARQVFARPPARYTEGSLVKKLEELGIGRPSTYATIIGTIQTRGYVERGDSEGRPRDVIQLTLDPRATDSKQRITRETVTENTGATKGKLVPTPSGQLIADFLSQYFEPVIDYGFTAKVEEEFDDIAEAKLPRNTMLTHFYEPFHALVAKSGSIDRASVAQAREVGRDPKSGKPIIAKFGRFGPYLQLGVGGEGAEKPQNAPLPRNTSVESVTLEEALKAFELPRLVGQTEDGQDIKANIGRFGPYIQIGKLFVSIKPHDPHDIDLATARTLYAEKLRSEAEKNITNFGDGVRVLKGRWGPYVTDGKKNAKIAKDTDPASITHEQALKLLADAPAAKKRPPFRRKKSTR